MTMPGAIPGRRNIVGPRKCDIETPGPAPVNIYYLSPEELEKYGPVNKAKLIENKNPEVDTVTTKSTMQIAREKISKEKLEELLSKGMTLATIASINDLPTWAVVELKKQYWPKNTKKQNIAKPALTDNLRTEAGSQIEPDKLQTDTDNKLLKIMTILYPDGVQVSQYADFITAIKKISNLC